MTARGAWLPTVTTRLVAAALLNIAAPAAQASDMKLERVTSPGGIEAWLVESHANPLIAIRFAFRGGATQDDKGKEGLAYFVSAMMDEGAADLDALAFQEKAQGLAMRMDFDAGRDVMLGNLQTLTVNKDEVFDLARLALTKPRFDARTPSSACAPRSSPASNSTSTIPRRSPRSPGTGSPFKATLTAARSRARCNRSPPSRATISSLTSTACSPATSW